MRHTLDDSNYSRKMYLRKMHMHNYMQQAHQVSLPFTSSGTLATNLCAACAILLVYDDLWWCTARNIHVHYPRGGATVVALAGRQPALFTRAAHFFAKSSHEQLSSFGVRVLGLRLGSGL